MDTSRIEKSVGAHHTAALLSDGTVWTWGSNEFGQLADGTFSDHAYPIQACIPVSSTADDGSVNVDYQPIKNATAVAAGDTFTLVLIDGKDWVLGEQENVATAYRPTGKTLPPYLNYNNPEIGADGIPVLGNNPYTQGYIPTHCPADPQHTNIQPVSKNKKMIHKVERPYNTANVTLEKMG